MWLPTASVSDSVGYSNSLLLDNCYHKTMLVYTIHNYYANKVMWRRRQCLKIELIILLTNEDRRDLPWIVTCTVLCTFCSTTTYLCTCTCCTRWCHCVLVSVIILCCLQQEKSSPWLIKHNAKKQSALSDTTIILNYVCACVKCRTLELITCIECFLWPF